MADDSEKVMFGNISVPLSTFEKLACEMEQLGAAVRELQDDAKESSRKRFGRGGIANDPERRAMLLRFRHAVVQALAATENVESAMIRNLTMPKRAQHLSEE